MAMAWLPLLAMHGDRISSIVREGALAAGVEGGPRAGQGPEHLDDVVDDRLVVAPVERLANDEAIEDGGGRRRERTVAGAGEERHRRRRIGGRHDRRDRADPGGVAEGDELHDHAAHRGPDQVRPFDGEVIEDGHGVVGEVLQRVGGLARLVRRGSTDVAVVVPDHVAPSGGESPAEAVVPAQHRRAGAHHEEHGRVIGVAERLAAELDGVGGDGVRSGHGVPPGWR